jgi:hypothetical protein
MALEDLYGKVLALAVQTIRAQTMLPGLVNHETTGDRTQGATKGGITEVIVPPEFMTRDVVPAAVPPASAAAPNPTTVQIPLDFWKEVNFPLTEKHITLLENADTVAPMFLQNAAGPIVEQITASIMANYKGIYGQVGTPGTTPFAAAPTVAQRAKTMLTKQRCPRFNRVMALNSGAYGNATALDAFRDVDKSGRSETFLEGEITRAYGFSWYEDVGLDGISHVSTPLTAGAATANGVNALGAVTLSIAKLTNASPLVAGDILTIAGDSQQYVVRTAVSLIVGNTAVSISPPLRRATAGGEAIALAASAGVSLAFHPYALAFDSRPAARLNLPGVTSNFMTWVDDMTGVVLRLEIRDEYHQVGFYLSCLWGAKLVDPRLAVRVAGLVGE